jgi:hypothetical protein
VPAAITGVEVRADVTRVGGRDPRVPGHPDAHTTTVGHFVIVVGHEADVVSFVIDRRAAVVAIERHALGNRRRGALVSAVR